MLEAVVKRSQKFSSRSKVLIFGGGFSGQHIAAAIKKLEGNVLSSRRNSSKPGADFIYDSCKSAMPPANIWQGVTHVISCAPPLISGEDPILKNLNQPLKESSVQWIGYLSTTGVYGNCHGNWVDETNEPNPTQQRSIRRLACEKQWQKTGLPVQILRLPGIYGPGRSPLDQLKNEKKTVVDKPGQVFSRVHVDDIAGAVLHLIKLYSQGIQPPIINIADNIPETNLKVIEYAAKLGKYPIPPIESFETASKNMSPMALSFWEENRRISNKLLCDKLGYSLIHKDYKSGLKDCLEYEKNMLNL